MRSVFDRPSRHDRRFEEYVALCASRSSFVKGYTPAEHASALDRLLADLELDESAPIKEEIHVIADIFIKPGTEIESNHPQLALAATC